MKLLFAVAVQEGEEESVEGSLQSWRSKAEMLISVCLAFADPWAGMTVGTKLLRAGKKQGCSDIC